jgi:hypothetical protein
MTDLKKFLMTKKKDVLDYLKIHSIEKMTEITEAKIIRVLIDFSNIFKV